MKAVVINPDGRSACAEIPAPDLTPGGAILKTIACGVCGTDLLKIGRRLITNPTVLGHEYVGVIHEISPGAKDFKRGDVVVTAHHVPCGDCAYCRADSPTMCRLFKTSNFVPGGFAEFIGIGPGHLRQVTGKIPPDMPWREAVFTEPLACCLRHWRRSGLKAGNTAVVVGLGSIGLMMSALLKYHGVSVIATEIDATRRDTARDFGLATVQNDTGDDFTQLLLGKTGGRGADAAIFTAGPADLPSRAMGWISDGGAIHLFSHLSGEPATLDLALLYHREIRIIPTYSAAPADIRSALEFLHRGNFNFRRMLAPAYAPEDFDRAVADANERQVLKAVIQFA